MEILDRLIHHRRREAGLETAHVLADADLARFGSLLKAAERHPGRSPLDQRTEADLRTARESHDGALRVLREAHTPGRLRSAVVMIAVGRRALAAAQARLAGQPDPTTTRFCLFDPGHGLAADEVSWTSARHGTRQVPVCRRDAARIRSGRRPATRTVEVAGRALAWFDAGELTAPYLQGYLADDPVLAWLRPDAVHVRSGTVPRSAHHRRKRP